MYNSSLSFLDSGAELMLRSYLLPSAQTLPTGPQTTIQSLDISESLTVSPIEGQPIVGQYFDQDFFGSSGEILSNFVESGQVWALLIGIVIGYLIRGLTTY